jgi:FkbM family methyltransferase
MLWMPSRISPLDQIAHPQHLTISLQFKEHNIMAKYRNRVWIRKKIQMLIQETMRHRIYCFLGRTHGHQSCTDIKLSGYRVETILDIGANTGQSASGFMVAFPQAKIFCFEPVSSTYAKLVQNVQGATVQCYHLAVGNQVGHAKIYLGQSPLESSLVPKEKFCAQESVEITTVDKFTSENNIAHIDLLKIDTEGYDLLVLKGAKDVLSSGRVAFVQVEVGFHPHDKRHVLFDDVRDLMISNGFSIFGFYDQQLEWSGERKLRYANVMFFREPPLD